MKTVENQLTKELSEALSVETLISSQDEMMEQEQTSPDYTSMKFAILDIADPVSFASIKKFYGKS